MRKFQKMVSLFSGKSVPVDVREKFAVAASKARIFVFENPIIWEAEFLSEVRDLNIFSSIDAPFEVCSIEIAGSNPIGKDRFRTGLPNGRKSETYDCLLIQELGPSKYRIFTYMRDERTGEGYPISYAENDEFLAGACKKYFDSISLSNVCGEAVHVNSKVRIKGSNFPIRIREVIHVTQKKMTSATGPNGGPIDYSHRFEIRGHWRKIDGIGKDRQGNYCVKSMTWVVPHVKGPDDKPLVKKQRVIHAPPA